MVVEDVVVEYVPFLSVASDFYYFVAVAMVKGPFLSGESLILARRKISWSYLDFPMAIPKNHPWKFRFGQCNPYLMYEGLPRFFVFPYPEVLHPLKRITSWVFLS